MSLTSRMVFSTYSIIHSCPALLAATDKVKGEARRDTSRQRKQYLPPCVQDPCSGP